MPLCFNLKISRLCQTLSKALDMSKKNTSNTSKISVVIANRWLIQASPCWKLDWILEMSLLVEQ